MEVEDESYGTTLEQCHHCGDNNNHSINLYKVNRYKGIPIEYPSRHQTVITSRQWSYGDGKGRFLVALDAEHCRRSGASSFLSRRTYIRPEELGNDSAYVGNFRLPAGPDDKRDRTFDH